MIRTEIRTSEIAMHARMTFTLDTQIVDLLKIIVPAKQRSQYVEEILRKALRRAEMEADYEAMANDPESQADAEFYKDFCGDIE